MPIAIFSDHSLRLYVVRKCRLNSYGTGIFVVLDKTIEAYMLEIFRDKSDAFGKLFVALHPEVTAWFGLLTVTRP